MTDNTIADLAIIPERETPPGYLQSARPEKDIDANKIDTIKVVMHEESRLLETHPLFYTFPFDQEKCTEYAAILGYHRAIETIYQEESQFHQRNMKTSLLQSIMETIVDNVFDGATIPEEMTTTKLEDIARSLFLHGRCLILKDSREFTVYKPYSYIVEKDQVFIYTSDMSEEYIHIVRQSPFQGAISTPKGKVISVNFVELTLDRLITDGVLELALLDSLSYTLLQGDIAGGQIITFVDKQYISDDFTWNNTRVAFMPTQSIKNLNPDGANVRPLLEHVSPDLRSTEHQTISQQITDRIASVLGVSNDLLSSGSATQSTILGAKTSKKFNKLKKRISMEINRGFEEIGFKGFKLELEKFRLDSDEAIIKNAVLITGNNIGTVEESLKKLYPHLSKRESRIMYLKGEIKAGRPLTLDENEDAIKYKLIKEEEPANNEAQSTEPDSASEAEIHAEANVPVPGLRKE